MLLTVLPITISTPGAATRVTSSPTSAQWPAVPMYQPDPLPPLLVVVFLPPLALTFVVVRDVVEPLLWKTNFIVHQLGEIIQEPGRVPVKARPLCSISTPSGRARPSAPAALTRRCSSGVYHFGDGFDSSSA